MDSTIEARKIFNKNRLRTIYYKHKSNASTFL